MENAGQQIDDEDLAAVLHEKGIGTPATRADIIENLIAKGYVVRLGKALRPTVKGIRLIDTLRRIHIDRLDLARAHRRDRVPPARGRARPAHAAATSWARSPTTRVEIVERAKSFEYDELYDANETFGNVPDLRRGP